MWKRLVGQASANFESFEPQKGHKMQKTEKVLFAPFELFGANRPAYFDSGSFNIKPFRTIEFSINYH